MPVTETKRKQLPGKFVWFEHVSRDAKKAQAFYGEVLGWKSKPMPMGDETYDIIYAGDQMIGGYTAPENGDKPHWISYVSVDNVDAAVRTATQNGAKIVEPLHDVPDVGRQARIADPQGAELNLFKNANADPPDVKKTAPGHFLWNELHTHDPAKALQFYEKVVGYSHQAMDNGPNGTYYVLQSSGNGRAGVTGYLQEGNKPHWLPYVAVDDVDKTIERARKAGGRVHFGPEDIPNVGRFGVVQDPVGAYVAVMKPQPM